MTTLEIVFAIFAIALLFTSYMGIGALIVSYQKIPYRWLRISAVIFWPMTFIVCFVIKVFMGVHEVFKGEPK